jgi:hypothetical protein
MAPFQGRGAPEIDIIEAMQGDSSELPNTFIKRPYQSASLQVAPGIDFDRPILGHRPHKVSEGWGHESRHMLVGLWSFLISMSCHYFCVHTELLVPAFGI